MMRTLASLMLVSLLGMSSAWGSDLLQIYELALRHDSTLQAARAGRDAAMESRPQALSQLLPNLFATGETNRVNRDVHRSKLNGSSNETFGRSQASLGLVQPLYNRERWIQLEQTDQTIASASARYADARQDLILRTAEAYFNIHQAQDDLTFSRANKKAIARQLDQAKQRFEVGLIAITDVHEAQAAYDRSRSTVIAAENALDDAWEALLVIIQPADVPALSRLRKELPLAMPQPEDIGQWSEAAQRQNLGIIAALNDTEFARKNIEVQRSGHYPTLDAVGSYTVDNTTDRTDIYADTASIGLQLNLPLYTGGGVSSQVRQAQSEFEQAQKDLDSQRRSVNEQVRNAFRGVESAIIQVQALQATTVSAQSALDATEAGYEVGTRTIIDVLDVQRRKFETDRDYRAARYAYILEGLRLKRAASILSRQDLKVVNGWLTDDNVSVAPSGILTGK